MHIYKYHKTKIDKNNSSNDNDHIGNNTNGK
jgi:hypothetical protein